MSKKYILNSITTGILGTNCYILSDSKSLETLVIDPGSDGEKILEKLKSDKLKVTAILNTHCHADHIGANDYLKKSLNVPIYIHQKDSLYLKDSVVNGSSFIGESFISPSADICLNDGDEIVIGSLKISIIHTPGHTPGSICAAVENLLFTGDTLFMESIGRYDFPFGSRDDLMASLDKFINMNPDTIVLPGHGPSSTIMHELKYNDFLKLRNRV